MSEYVIQYGKRIETTQLDENGSFVTNETTVMDFRPVDNRQRFEIRVRVANQQEELAEYLRFRDETKHMRNAEFRIEHTGKANEQGYYYIVKCYTIRHDE